MINGYVFLQRRVRAIEMDDIPEQDRICVICRESYDMDNVTWILEGVWHHPVALPCGKHPVSFFRILDLSKKNTHSGASQAAISASSVWLNGYLIKISITDV